MWKVSETKPFSIVHSSSAELIEISISQAFYICDEKLNILGFIVNAKQVLPKKKEQVGLRFYLDKPDEFEIVKNKTLLSKNSIDSQSFEDMQNKIIKNCENQLKNGKYVKGSEHPI